MSVRRDKLVQGRLEALLAEHPGADPEREGSLDEPIVQGLPLTRRTAIALFEAGLQSRLQDFEARRMRERGDSFYTIGSSGHESNAVFGELLRVTDPALLHYRSGAFMVARARHGHGETPLFDTMLAFAASAEDPIAGGRHKVFGSASLHVPPQTSTIASHLPKAVGMAFALARMKRLGIAATVPHDSVVYCSFGDASANHATAQAGFTAAAAAALHRQPCPVLFVCEDNGLGISVRTPDDYIRRCFHNRAGLDYFEADGHDYPETHAQAEAAIARCRRTRRPVFFRLRTVRLMGHAGSDVETSYLSEEELDAIEARDPLLALAELLLASGAIAPAELRAMHASIRARVGRAAEEVTRRPKLRSAAEIKAPLELPDPRDLRIPVASAELRAEVFGGRLPEDDPRPRHLAYRLAQGLEDVLAAWPNSFVFGEDVARKGGVYHVTAGLWESFGSGRVFNTILDETTILGLAQGMGQLGSVAIPEIQYLAYVHNAIDQIRGEAATLRFFSQRQFRNPIVVRIASYAYQKGFGGHFHNDNSLGALLDIPGLIIASPARADDAVSMLRTCVAAAAQHGVVCLFLEPIALYMTKDLFDDGDGLWQFAYPAPGESVALGEPRRYGDGDDLVIVSWANGLYLSLRAQRALEARGVSARVLDLRWLAPLAMDAVLESARETGRVLVVDECRASGGGPSARILAELAERTEGVRMRRITAVDTFIPLGDAANAVLVQEHDIVAAALELCGGAKP